MTAALEKPDVLDGALFVVGTHANSTKRGTRDTI